jgi:uncharacterized protein YciI
LLISNDSLLAQDLKLDEDGYEIFTYQDGDTSYTMKKYYIAFLKRGPNRDQDQAEANAIQSAHLEHMSQLAEQKKICIAGPFGDDTDMRGIVIYSAKSLEEAKSYAESDPAVINGVLIAELHPWWAAKGSKLD